MGTRIKYLRPDGKEESGYFARAAQASAPGLIVIQEWWGVQDQIIGITERLAASGFDVLAPDLYKGVTVPYHDSEKASAEMNSLNFLEATDQAVRGAALFLKKSSDKVGITGFCMGGAVTILAAARVPEISAAVAFYGLPPAEAAGPADVKVPLQGHFAMQDDWCTPAVADQFEAGLQAAHKDYAFFRYEAHHGFMNEQRPDAHQRAAAEQAWGRMLEFWKKNL